MILKMHRVGLCLVLVAGCAGGAQEAQRAEAATGKPEAATGPATEAGGSGELLSLDESVDFCVRLHEEAASCAGEFIDLNLELRGKYFPDFAEAIADPAKREELRKIGIEETMADGTGPLEPRRQRCTEYSQHGPPSPRSVVSHMEGCYAKATCAEKIECMRPVLDERYSKRAKGQK